MVDVSGIKNNNKINSSILKHEYRKTFVEFAISNMMLTKLHNITQKNGIYPLENTMTYRI